MLSAIPPHALASLKQLAEKMEKILLVALDGYGNTFVEPKVELGARFGHLVCESNSNRIQERQSTSNGLLNIQCASSTCFKSHKPSLPSSPTPNSSPTCVARGQRWTLNPSATSPRWCATADMKTSSSCSKATSWLSWMGWCAALSHLEVPHAAVSL